MYFPVAGIEVSPLVPPLVAFGVSFFASMGGISGAFLLLPFQMSVLGYTHPSVSATNQFYNVVAIPSGVYRYIKEKRMVWPLTIAVAAGTLPGVFIGAFVRVAWLPDPRLFKLFAACVLLYIGGRLIRDLVKGKPMPKVIAAPGSNGQGGSAAGDASAAGGSSPAGTASSAARDTSLAGEARRAIFRRAEAAPAAVSVPAPRAGTGGAVQAAAVPAGSDFFVHVQEFSARRISYTFQGETHTCPTVGIFMLSFIVGIVGGTYGIGGGAIIAPFFVSWFRLPVHTISGATLMGTFLTSVAGVAFYMAIAPLYPTMSVAPDWTLGLLFGLGGVAGMYLGARCQKRVPASAIKWMLGVVIVATALKYVLEFFK